MDMSEDEIRQFLRATHEAFVREFGGPPMCRCTMDSYYEITEDEFNALWEDSDD